jgi:hypothetical protein
MDRHRSLRPQRDRAYDVIVIVISGILIVIALTMEILDRRDQTNAAQVAPLSSSNRTSQSDPAPMADIQRSALGFARDETDLDTD